jgi:bifunctional UDP-N-acetylglucosamine pyrophosphorylase/glucosamine-1-phosphate N-acetyltransferase
MIDLVLAACRKAGARRVVVVLNPAQREVVDHLVGRCEVVFQAEQLGTGHALAQVPSELLERDVVVVNADSPLIRASTIGHLVERHASARATVTLASVFDGRRDDGRIVRSPSGEFERIVEARDATAKERASEEHNVGLYCFRSAELTDALAHLRPDNAAGEFYLTDVVARLRPVHVVVLDDQDEAMGINDRIQLARAELALRYRLLEDMMLSGVTIVDPGTTFVDVGVSVDRDTVIEPFTILRGKTRIGADCTIGPYAQLTDTTVGEGCRIESSWLRECRVGDRSDCGPYSKLRPGTELAQDVHVGSYAEIVRSKVGAHSKVPHFSYLGDTTVGQNVNIAAGTITANFDKGIKSQTVIEDNAFIGVDTMLRAPVRIGRGARTGAGSVVTKDVPPGALAVGMPARIIRKPPEPGA